MPRVLLALLLLAASGCVVWNTEVARATAGSALSRPVVRASLSLHREWVIVWGRSETWQLVVDVDGQRYETGLDEATAVRLSPDRRAVAVRSARDGRWQRYVLGSAATSTAAGTLERDGEPTDELEWPDEHLREVADAVWLVWTVGGAAALVAVALVVWRLRRARPPRETS